MGKGSLDRGKQKVPGLEVEWKSRRPVRVDLSDQGGEGDGRAEGSAPGEGLVRTLFLTPDSSPPLQCRSPPPVPIFLLCLFPSPFQAVRYSGSSCLMKGCSVGEYYYAGGQKLGPWPLTAQFQDLGPG